MASAAFLRSVVATLVASAVLVGGCDGGGEPSDATATTAPTPTSEATSTPTILPSATPSATPTPTATPIPQPDGSLLVACGDILAPLDKERRLGADCSPPDLVALPGEMSSGGTQYLRADAAAAFRELFGAALADGFTIFAASSYRSYATQVAVYAGHVANLDQARADRISARPGHSEHQLGTTTDVTSASAGFGLDSFEGTPEADWLAANSWRFGFIVSYPAGKEAITGYSYEPWHIRWVGKEEAARVRESGLTLHEWLLK